MSETAFGKEASSAPRSRGKRGALTALAFGVSAALTGPVHAQENPTDLEAELMALQSQERALGYQYNRDIAQEVIDLRAWIRGSAQPDLYGYGVNPNLINELNYRANYVKPFCEYNPSYPAVVPDGSLLLNGVRTYLFDTTNSAYTLAEAQGEFVQTCGEIHDRGSQYYENLDQIQSQEAFVQEQLQRGEQ